MSKDVIKVLENGEPILFTFEDLMRYHGNLLPGGVAHGFKSLQAALILLGAENNAERREIQVATAFSGAGARDAIEMVTRAVSRGQYQVDESLALPFRGFLSPYVFRFTYRSRSVTLQVREGMVRADFRALSALGSSRTAEQEQQLIALRQEMADRLKFLPALDVYEPVSNM